MCSRPSRNEYRFGSLSIFFLFCRENKNKRKRVSKREREPEEEREKDEKKENKREVEEMVMKAVV